MNDSKETPAAPSPSLFFVTKWWRTRGILIGRRDDHHEGWVYCSGFSHKIGKDAFPNIQAAMHRVRSMAANRANAYQKQADRCQLIAEGKQDVKVSAS